jgi:predicted nucleic acid-binding protein
MIVVDAMVLADFFAGESNLRRAAIRLSDEDPVWISCSLWRYELGNVLWKKVRVGHLDLAAANRCVEQGETIVTETVANLQWSRILGLAADAGLTFYDASYVWLARARGLKLRTRDTQILRECSDVAKPMPEG